LERGRATQVDTAEPTGEARMTGANAAGRIAGRSIELYRYRAPQGGLLADSDGPFAEMQRTLDEQARLMERPLWPLPWENLIARPAPMACMLYVMNDEPLAESLGDGEVAAFSETFGWPQDAGAAESMPEGEIALQDDDLGLAASGLAVASAESQPRFALGAAAANNAYFEHYYLAFGVQAHEQVPSAGAAVPSETVFWAPLLRTDEQGRATVRFRLPPQAAGYRVRVEAHSPGGRLGMAEGTILARPRVSGE